MGSKPGGTAALAGAADTPAASLAVWCTFSTTRRTGGDDFSNNPSDSCPLRDDDVDDDDRDDPLLTDPSSDKFPGWCRRPVRRLLRPCRRLCPWWWRCL